jgi:hypothetical protein
MKQQILLVDIGTVLSFLRSKFSEFPYRDLYEGEINTLYFTAVVKPGQAPTSLTRGSFRTNEILLQGGGLFSHWGF